MCRALENSCTEEYDLVDHLGNVTTQVSDRKTGTLATNDIQADVLSYQQYYPFGWNMPGRSLNEDKARFDFQNQETDTEWLGGNAVAYKYRFHDPRLGRFLSVDPLKDDYPWNSAYAFSENQVIAFIELEGLEKTESDAQGSDNAKVPDGNVSDGAQDSYGSNGDYGYGNESSSPESGAQGESWWIRAAKFLGKKGAGVVGLMLEPFELNSGEQDWINDRNQRYREKEKDDREGYITLYRGTDRVAENEEFKYTGQVLSDASITASKERNPGHDLSMHTNLIGHFGSLEKYAEAHGESHNFLDGLTVGGQKAERTLISFTKNDITAHLFGSSNDNPYTIYKIRVKKEYVIKQPNVNSGEMEYLVPMKVTPIEAKEYHGFQDPIKK